LGTAPGGGGGAIIGTCWRLLLEAWLDGTCFCGCEDGCDFSKLLKCKTSISPSNVMKNAFKFILKYMKYIKY